MALSDYDGLVQSAVTDTGIPSGLTAGDFISLITAIIQKESSFNPSAVSSSGLGIGLMQIESGIWGNTFGVTIDQLFDPFTNIKVGASILKNYIDSFGVQQGIAAFRAGPSGRSSQTAVNYVNTVIGYWNNFKAKLRSLIGMPQGPLSYFVEPSQPFDISSDTPFYSLDTIQPTTFDQSYSSIDSISSSWGWIALLMVTIFFVMDEIS